MAQTCIWLGFMLCNICMVTCPVKTAAQIITTFAGNGLAGYYGNGGAATLAILNSPTCIAIDGAGNVYINDQRDNCVRKVNTPGVISTFAGTDTGGYNGDNITAFTAKLNQNWGVAVDDTGNLYIADQENYRVRKVNTSGIITTFAGNGIPGYSGDGGPATAAQMQAPLGIAVDIRGNVYISDPGSFCIRRVNPAGIISRFAGNGTYGYGGDNGLAVNAMLSYPRGIAVDTFGNVYICDADNNRIRKVDTSGIITTIAGTGMAGNSGDNGPATSAQLNSPIGIFHDNSGDIYIADFYNNRIRMISTSGIITTVAGTGVSGFSGDDGPALQAELSHPISVAIDGNGNMYIADLDNIRVRKINTIPALSFNPGHTQNLPVCENAGATPVNSLLAVTDLYTGLSDTWNLIAAPVHGTAVISYTTPTTGGVLIPSSTSYTPDAGYAGYDSFKVRVTNGIASDTIAIQVTVKPLLVSAGTITGPSAVCVNATIHLTDTLAGGTWHSLYMASIAPTVNGSIVTGILPGIDTITYTLNGCGTATSTIIITVNPLPDAGTINGAVHVCIGSSITLTETIASGVWSSTYGKTSIAPITGGSIVTGISTGMDIIKYSITDSVCTGVATHPVIVDTIPQTGIITGPANICVGAMAVYTDLAQDGTWSSASSSVATIVNDTVTGLMAGMFNLSYSATNSCGIFTATKSVNIIPPPAIPVVTVFENILSVPAGYGSYQWLLNGSPIQGAVTDSFEVSLFPATYAVIVTDSLGCPATSAEQAYNGCNTGDIKIYPNPPTSILYIQWCKKLNARIICADGKTVGTIEDVHEIDLTELPDGVYFISLFDTNEHKLMTKRITKLNR